MTDQDLLNKIYNEYGPYGYIPLLSGAIVFTVIFGLLSIAHTFRAVHSKHYFMLVVAFGAFCECVGNGLRIYGHFHSQVTDPYIAQQVLLVVTPVFFAAIHFTLLGRVLTMFGSEYSLVKSKYIVPVFVTVDVISLIIQGAGSGIAAVAEIDGKDTTSGGNIVVGGLALQLLAYMAANVLAIVFAIRTRKSPPNHAAWNHQTKIALLFTLISALFILFRSIFRTAELAVGWVGVISTTEWTLLAFDSSLVSIAVFLLVLFHPSIYLPGGRGKTEDQEEVRDSGFEMTDASASLTTGPNTTNSSNSTIRSFRKSPPNLE